MVTLASVLEKETGGRELNESDDVVICSVWRISPLRNSQNQVVTPKMVSQEASELS